MQLFHCFIAIGIQLLLFSKAARSVLRNLPAVLLSALFTKPCEITDSLEVTVYNITLSTASTFCPHLHQILTDFQNLSLAHSVEIFNNVSGHTDGRTELYDSY